MELSVADMSNYLGVTPDTIKRWLKQGKLPVSKKGQTITFRRKDLENWARKNQIKLDFSKAAVKTEEANPRGDNELVSLVQAVERAGVFPGIPGNDTSEVFESAIAGMGFVPETFKSDLLSRLLEREAALSTGIGNGIAIPHPRVQPEYIESPAVLIGYPREPLAYNALDGKAVSVLFFLLCPDLKNHLHLLSVISFCLRNDSFVSFLKSGPKTADLLEKVGLLEQTYSI